MVVNVRHRLWVCYSNKQRDNVYCQDNARAIHNESNNIHYQVNYNARRKHAKFNFTKLTAQKYRKYTEDVLTLRLK